MMFWIVLPSMLDLPPHPGCQLPRPNPLFAMITSCMGGRSNEYFFFSKCALFSSWSIGLFAPTGQARDLSTPNNRKRFWPSPQLIEDLQINSPWAPQLPMCGNRTCFFGGNVTTRWALQSLQMELSSLQRTSNWVCLGLYPYLEGSFRSIYSW